MSNDSNLQQHLTTTIEDLLSLVFRLTRSTYSSSEDQTRGVEHMEIGEEQTKDTMMQDGEGECYDPSSLQLVYTLQSGL